MTTKLAYSTITGVPNLFKPDEAAPLLRVSGRTVRRWVKEGKLEAIRQPGGRVLITAEAIAAYIARDPSQDRVAS